MPRMVRLVTSGSRALKNAVRGLFGPEVAGAYADMSLRGLSSTVTLAVVILPFSREFLVRVMRPIASSRVSCARRSRDSHGMTIAVPPQQTRPPGLRGAYEIRRTNFSPLASCRCIRACFGSRLCSWRNAAVIWLLVDSVRIALRHL